ncbi:hypothetical protein [Photorhabdus heterorhabditis]|uniref:Uncharacterized protein n=1 Tax=Photorhabdus heterorhabditis TaxID=880156 RepID=A0A5B0WM20_9GAMM|nr:hypothetical protein [Photorhabdus heterorhabditis]KAA1187285.1 hypothetical protein F0L16_12745 [Photorhabdus heterorhabditis]KOY63187.1 hypothetical protein AM629_04575 [Photorhabdus heterorhabditis]MBS9441635.1 hypothetical protein [Photorhabdus heterorhabditis]NRN29844.1 hypothetical protein [Photorhabdus heterorhabditis subsp. aluminescens]
MPRYSENIEKITNDFSWLNEPELNCALYSIFDSSGTDIVQDVNELILPPGYRLVRVDSRLDLDIDEPHFELALLSDDAKEVVYYNKVIVMNDLVLNCSPASQTLVWRTKKPKHKAALSDLAAKIFFHYLIKTYDVVASNVNQIIDDISFWQARMYEALQFGLYVYGYDVMTCELRNILTEDDVGKEQSWLWGDAEYYMDRLAIISKIKLPDK